MATILVAGRDAVYRLAHGASGYRGSAGGAGAPEAPARFVETLSAPPGSRNIAPTSLTVSGDGRVWCGTAGGGVRVSEDAGLTWRHAGLDGAHIMSLAADPTREEMVWAGTEPSAVWHARAPNEWKPTAALETLPSAPEWAFPPRPDTHHVRWIAPHPHRPDHLWAAVEAGALIRTRDGGRSWLDRVEAGPYDTHELAIHPDRPETLRVAAGDGYFESDDAGATWTTPMEGLDVRYLRSVAVDPRDPRVVLVSASTGPRTAYAAGHGDGRVYRREGSGPWRLVTDGWPSPPTTIAPLLRPHADGALVAADERGVHRSDDGGISWRAIADFPDRPAWIRDLLVLGA